MNPLKKAKEIFDKVKNAIQKAVQAIKNIKKAIKFFITPIGTVIAWIILAIFGALILYVAIKTGATWLEKYFDIADYSYITEEDLEIIQQLKNSGYEAVIDAENFQNFRAFEYAILMDAAEYIRVSKQQMFDVYENQGEFEPERKMIEDKYSDKEEYKQKMEQLAKYYASGDEYDDAAIKLLNVDYMTNQSLLSEESLKTYIDLSKQETSRNISVTGTDENGSVLGGNNRVSGPFLVYEYRDNLFEKTTSEDEEVSISSSNTTIINGDDSTASATSTQTVNSTTSGDDATTQTSNDATGGIEPYIYIVREDIEFSYYFDENGNLIEIPLLLNSYNCSLEASTERSKEIDRALLGMPIRLFLDEDYSKFTNIPYYSDNTEYIVYKIPLRTLLGRYLPKAELFQAWSTLKEGINLEGEIDFASEILYCMQSVYNEACLLSEDKEIEEKTVSVEDENEINYKLTKDTTNKKSFIEFQKAGIERTEYDINGFTDIEDKTVKYVTGMSEAVSVNANERGNVTFTVDYAAHNSYLNEYSTDTIQVTINAERLGFESR